MSSDSDDFYSSFVRWAQAIGCPQPSPELFRRLARGNGADFLRLLITHVHPSDHVNRVRNALRLHGVSNDDKQVIGRADPEKDNQDQLAFLRRSHGAAIQEIEYLSQKQSEMERSIRNLSSSAVILENACRRLARDHLGPIGNLATIARNMMTEEGASPHERIVFMDDSGRLDAVDPVRSALKNLYSQLAENRFQPVPESLSFTPKAKLVDDLSSISRQHLSSLLEYQEETEPGSSDAIRPPISLGQLMQDSRNAHIGRFFDTLDKRNLAHEVQRRAQKTDSMKSVPEHIGLRARLDCLTRHIQRCEQELATAQAEYDHLHESLDSISELETKRARMHQELTALIKANRELRLNLKQQQTQCRQTQARIESSIQTANDKIGHLNRCFEIQASALLERWQSQERSDFEFDNAVSWQAIGQNLGISSCQCCDPVSILIAIRSQFEKLCTLRISSMAGSPIMVAAEQIDCGDIEGLTSRCKDLHLNSEAAMVQLNEMLKSLKSLDKACDDYEQLMKQWWEQPAQYTVPDEQRFGLNINGWIERRRKLVAEHRRDDALKSALF